MMRWLDRLNLQPYERRWLLAGQSRMIHSLSFATVTLRR